MKKILLFALVALIAGTGCKKDNGCKLDEDGIDGSYKIVSFVTKANASATEVNEFATLDACEKDDILHFNGGNVYMLQDAGVVCTPTTQFNSTWSISGNNLTVNGEIYQIVNYSCSGFTLQQTDNTGGYEKIGLSRVE